MVLDRPLDTPSNMHRPGLKIDDDHGSHGVFAQVDLSRMNSGGLDGGFWVICTAQALGTRRATAPGAFMGWHDLSSFARWSPRSPALRAVADRRGVRGESPERTSGW